MNGIYKHLFFDMDNTLTASRQRINPELADLLHTLPQTISIISGAKLSRILSQTAGLVANRMAQSGNHTTTSDNTVLWREKLPDRYKKEIYAHIFNLKKHTTHSVPDENDLIDDRGSQITFSMYGHNAPHAEKNAFDPDFSYRKKVLSQAPFNSENIEVNITGSTCFDYTVKGRNKGFNIDRFIKYMNWRHSECLYFGDAIFPGGNDYTVVGIIDTVKVDSYRDTQKILKEKFT